METIRKILEQIKETDSEELKMKSLQESDDVFLQMNANSISKRRRDLTRRLNDILHLEQNDLVQYKIVAGSGDKYPVKAIASSIEAFQELVTSIYDALKEGPKIKFQPTPKSTELSTMEFAGTSPGSLIISMVIPDDRMLVGETDFELTLGFIEKIFKTTDSDELRELSTFLGVSSITKTYKWADINSSYLMDTEIKYGGSLDSGNGFKISHNRFNEMRELISDKSEQDYETIELDCKLVGFDGKTSYFHVITIEDKNEIKGKLSENLSTSWTTDIPYRAKLTKKTHVIFSTGKTKETWTLENLEPLSLPG